MILVILQKQVYGNTVYYPINAAAKAVAAIAGTKTLTREALELAQSGLAAEIQITHMAPAFSGAKELVSA